MRKKVFLPALACVMVLGLGVTAYAAPETMEDGTVFDAEYYAQNNPDVAAAVGTSAGALYQHYVQYGKAEGRKACADEGETVFDAEYYAQNNPDVAAAVGTGADALYQHYIQYGKAEGRKASAGDGKTVSVMNAAAQQTAKKYTCVIEPGDEQYWPHAAESHKNFKREDFTDEPLYIYLRDQLEAGIDGTGGRRSEGVIWAPGYEGIIGEATYVYATWSGLWGDVPRDYESSIYDNLMIDMMKAYPNAVASDSYYSWTTDFTGLSEDVFWGDWSSVPTKLDVTVCLRK